MAEIWGWVEEDQRAYHARGFDPSTTQIVVVDGKAAGSLSVERRAAEIYLGRIEVHPDLPGRGIGTSLIRGLQAEGLPVSLDVFVINTRARPCTGGWASGKWPGRPSTRSACGGPLPSHRPSARW